MTPSHLFKKSTTPPAGRIAASDGGCPARLYSAVAWRPSQRHRQSRPPTETTNAAEDPRRLGTGWRSDAPRRGARKGAGLRIPYCTSGGWATDGMCRFRTFEECLTFVQGVGGSCARNPRVSQYPAHAVSASHPGIECVSVARARSRTTNTDFTMRHFILAASTLALQRSLSRSPPQARPRPWNIPTVPRANGPEAAAAAIRRSTNAAPPSAAWAAAASPTRATRQSERRHAPAAGAALAGTM